IDLEALEELTDAGDVVRVREVPVGNEPSKVVPMGLDGFRIAVDGDDDTEARSFEPERQSAGPAEQVGSKHLVDVRVAQPFGERMNIGLIGTSVRVRLQANEGATDELDLIAPSLRILLDRGACHGRSLTGWAVR
ncbi:MAG: hypothetical protein QOD39_936, partial [Mycobacterium sp.]|nr:hypothetical protein [Mycobacterium sp.]